jgi:hypothetical protein
MKERGREREKERKKERKKLERVVMMIIEGVCHFETENIRKSSFADLL